MWTPGAVDFFRILNEQASGCTVLAAAGVHPRDEKVPWLPLVIALPGRRLHELPNQLVSMAIASHRLPAPLLQVAVVAGVNRDVMLLRVGQVRAGAWKASGDLPAACGCWTEMKQAAKKQCTQPGLPRCAGDTSMPFAIPLWFAKRSRRSKRCATSRQRSGGTSTTACRWSSCVR